MTRSHRMGTFRVHKYYTGGVCVSYSVTELCIGCNTKPQGSHEVGEGQGGGQKSITNVVNESERPHTPLFIQTITFNVN